MERRGKKSAAHAAANLREESLTLDAVRTDNTHVSINVNDLVAYEYVDDAHCWQWGLATVAALPGPRLVQLLLWRHDSVLQSASLPPTAISISVEERNKAIERLEQLRQQRALVNAEAEAMNRRLAVKHASYAAERRRIEDEAQAAERTLLEVRTRVMEIEARDWREIRCYRNPPAIVVLVMEAVLTVLGERCLSWSQIQNAIRGHDFVQKVEKFDPLKLSEATKRHVRQKFLSNPKFTYADAMNGSHALGYLQQWVVAQVETATAMESLAEYDISHSDERMAISGIEQQIEAFQKALQEYTNEEDRLRSLLEGQPLVIDNSCGGSVDSGRGSGAATKGDAAEKKVMCDADTNIIPSRKDAATKRFAKAGANSTNNATLDDGKERIHGTDAIWTFTEELIVTLRSAILCNYDQPESTIIRLTPEQVREIEDALKQRGSKWNHEQRAKDVNQKLQAALEELRGRHGHALKRVQELESGNHTLQRELQERNQELDRLNQAINENGVLLYTPRCSQAGSSLRSTPRIGRPPTLHRTAPGSPLLLDLAAPPPPPAAAAAAAAPGGGIGSGSVPLVDVEGDSAEKIVDLEKRLTRALHENPTEAQVQMLEDDLRALQEELRRSKEELEKFRTATVPYCYTSSALRMDQWSTPEAQLAAAQRQIEELEVALGESLERQRQQQQQLQCPAESGESGKDKLHAHIQCMEEELRHCRQSVETAAERLNDELHAHGETRQALLEKEQELQALWQLQNINEREKEVTSDALHEAECQLNQLREQLRAKEECTQRLQERLDGAERRSTELQRGCEWMREDRAGHLREIIGRLTQEAQRQKHESKSTESVLQEVQVLLRMGTLS